MPWSVADFSAFRLSVGEPLLSIADDLELHAGRVVGVELLDEELPAVQLVVADRTEQAGERIDPGDLDDLALQRLGAGLGLRERGAGRGGERDAEAQRPKRFCASG